MRILAVDPGNKQSAFILLHRHSDRLEIGEKGIIPNVELLKQIKDSKLDADHLAIEMIASMGMAVGKEVFETVFWIGRFVQAWSPRKWKRIFRSEEKMYLCGNMRAKDTNIRQALIDKFGAPGTKKNPGVTYGIKADIWAALAVGVTFLEI